MIQVHYSKDPLFRKSTISTNPKPNPKADLNPNPNLNLNVSTVARLYNGLFGIADLWNSGPLE